MTVIVESANGNPMAGRTFTRDAPTLKQLENLVRAALRDAQQPTRQIEVVELTLTKHPKRYDVYAVVQDGSILPMGVYVTLELSTAIFD